MTPSAKTLHRVGVDSDVFAALWRQRQPGEDSENDILRRIYGLNEHASRPQTELQPSNATMAAPASTPPERVAPRSVSQTGQTIHRDMDTDFPDGLEIFRGFKGQDYRARIVAGGWRLESDGMVYRSLAALNRAIGGGQENVWMAWFFRDRNNRRRPLDDYRQAKR